MVEVALRLRDFVPLDPLSAVLLRNSHFDPIFVDALDDSSVALQWSTSNSDGLSHFEVFFFSHKPRLNVRFEASSCFFKVSGDHCTIVSSFDDDSVGFIEFWVE